MLHLTDPMNALCQDAADTRTDALARGIPPSYPGHTLFIAESLTPLFHTPAYAELPVPVQRRYNQLHALYFNEQIAFFEQEMLSPALLELLRESLPGELRTSLIRFYEEEQTHTARFREVNRQTAPELYLTEPYYFIRLPKASAALLRWVSRRPRKFPLLIWLALLQEERSLFFSKLCIQSRHAIDPVFAAMHRAHLADEVEHVRWDEDLLDFLWPSTPPGLRALNVRLLAWMVREYFSLPKRAGRRVVDRLVEEFPGLDAAKLANAMSGLAHNPAYLRSLYAREFTPRTFARWDNCPEFKDLLWQLEEPLAA